MRVMSSVPEVKRHPGGDWLGAMPFQQLLDFRRDHVVAAGAVMEDAELVLHLFRAVNRDRDADVVLDEELDDVRAQQRGVGRQAEVNRFPELGGASAPVRDRRLEHREIEQRLAAEKGEVGDAAALPEQELDAVARRLLGHEFRLLAVLGVDDLVLAVLVAIRARQVALVRDVHAPSW